MSFHLLQGVCWKCQRRLHVSASQSLKKSRNINELESLRRASQQAKHHDQRPARRLSVQEPSSLSPSPRAQSTSTSSYPTSTSTERHSHFWRRKSWPGVATRKKHAARWKEKMLQAEATEWQRTVYTAFEQLEQDFPAHLNTQDAKSLNLSTTYPLKRRAGEAYDGRTVQLLKGGSSLKNGFKPTSSLADRICRPQHRAYSTNSRRPVLTPHTAFSKTSILQKHISKSIFRNSSSTTGHGFLQSLPTSPAEDMKQSPKIREKLRQWQYVHDSAQAQRYQEQLLEAAKLAVEFENRGLPSHLKANSPAASNAATDPGSGMSSIDHEAFFINPGDLVGIRKPKSVTLGVCIRRFGRISLVYSMEGQWVQAHLEDMAYFVVRGFCKPEALEGLRPYLPTTAFPTQLQNVFVGLSREVPRDVSGHVLDAMNRFSLKANEFYRKGAKRLASVYDRLAFVNNYRYLELDQIAREVFRIRAPNLEVPPAALWAVLKHLEYHDGFEFDTWQHWNHGLHELLPLKLYKSFKLVQRWVREHQEQAISVMRPSKSTAAESKQLSSSKLASSTHLSRFASRVRKVVLASRQHRRVLETGVGPDQTSPSGKIRESKALDMKEDDVHFIRYLRRWTTKLDLRTNNQFWVLGAAILRATGLYEHLPVTPATGRLLLQELGIIYPWENAGLHNPRLPLVSNPWRPALRELAKHSQKEAASEDTQDSMADLRHDWGDLKVFCIDDASAHEIDDGISIEKIPEEPGNRWIHIHVANPTAFIKPNSFTAEYASKLGQTLYLVEDHFAMLPEQLTKDKLSLAPNRPTITFSAKLDSDGDLLDYKITPGFVRNVCFLTPTILREHLSQQADADSATDFTFTSVVGEFETREDKPSRPLAKELGEADVSLLTSMAHVLNARRQKRLGATVPMDNFQWTPVVSVSRDSLVTAEHSQGYRVINGDPSLSLRVKYFQSETIFAINGHNVPNPDYLVPNAMELAGEIAGRWCAERDLPAPYLGAIVPPGSAGPKSIELLEQKMSKMIEEGKPIPQLVLSYYTNIQPRTRLSSYPQVNERMHMPVYARATSPLRRFTDMVLHWQIEAVLRHQAKNEIGTLVEKSGHATESARVADFSYLPFSRDTIKSMIPRLGRQARLISHMNRQSVWHWIHHFLFRAFYFQESTPQLPETFTVTLSDLVSRSRDVQGRWGTIHELSVAGFLHNEHSADLQPGDSWEARIASVDPMTQMINLQPVRLVSKLTSSGIEDYTTVQE